MLANTDRYSDYLPSVQKKMGSFEIVGLTEFNNNTNSIRSIAKFDGTEARLSSSLSSAPPDGYITRITTTEAAARLTLTLQLQEIGDVQMNTTNTVNNIVDKKPELVLGLGDYSYNPTSDECWFKIVKTIEDKMKIAIGNHDYRGTGEIYRYMNHFGLTTILLI